MEHFLEALGELLPGYLYDIVEWDFIPLMHIKDRHSDLAAAPIEALFGAYLWLGKNLDLRALASQDIPGESWGCMRCGFCCTFMRPGPVKAATYRGWEKAVAPVARFYKPSGKEKRNSTYRCWYHDGIRLRMCPFMFTNRIDQRPFCSIYRMGEKFRPPACSRYIPRHETCIQRKVAVQSWEST
jgi:hypothetical protein